MKKKIGETGGNSYREKKKKTERVDWTKKRERNQVKLRKQVLR